MALGKKAYGLLIVLTTLVFAVGLGAVGVYESENNQDSMTGSFTEAETVLEPKEEYEEDSEIEEIIWKFDGEEITGEDIVKKRFSEEKHNLTVVVKKSNGEEEIHKTGIMVSR